MKTEGKTLIVFLVVIIVVLLSLSGIALFFLQKETELRKTAEASLEQLKTQEAKLQGDLKESKKQVFVLEEKNKEADEKINDLMDNLDLEKGLREESGIKPKQKVEIISSKNGIFIVPLVKDLKELRGLFGKEGYKHKEEVDDLLFRVMAGS